MGMAASLMIGVSADISAASKQMASLASDMRSLGESAKGAAASFKTLVSADLAADAIKAVAGSMFDTAKASIQLAGELEQSKVAFTTMLGSAQKADAFLKELATFANNTPFELKGLQESSKKLLAFGFDSRDIIPIMTSLGNAIAGLGGGEAEINRVTMALGQMQAKGKVSAEEMMQLAELGIPAWDMLAKQIGTSVPEAMKQAEKGAIPSAKAIEALVNGMNERFPNMMANQSKTLLGAWGNLQDGIKNVNTNIGTDIVKTFNLTPIISNVAEAVKEFGREIEASGIAGALNKAFSPELKAAIVGVGVALTAAMIPALGTAAPFIATAAAIAFAVQPIIKNWDALTQEFHAIFNGITVMATDLYNAFKTVFGKVGELVQGVLKFLADKLKPVWDVLPEGIKKAIGSVGSTMVQLPGVVVPHIRNMAVGVGKATLDMSRTAFSPLYDAVEGTQAFFANMTKAIPTMTGGMSSKVALHMKQAAGGLTGTSKEAEKAAKEMKKHAEAIASGFKAIPDGLRAIETRTKALNMDSFAVASEKVGFLEGAIKSLIDKGVSPSDKVLKGHIATWAVLSQQVEETRKQMAFNATLNELGAEMQDAAERAALFGDKSHAAGSQAKVLERMVDAMRVTMGNTHPAVMALAKRVQELNAEAEDAKKALDFNARLTNLGAEFKDVAARAKLFGDESQVAGDQAKVLERMVDEMRQTMGNTHPAVIALAARVNELRNEQLEADKATRALTEGSLTNFKTTVTDTISAINGMRDGLTTIASVLGVEIGEGLLGGIVQFGNLALAVMGVAESATILGPKLLAVGKMAMDFVGMIGGMLAPIGAVTAGLALGATAVSLLGAGLLITSSSWDEFLGRLKIVLAFMSGPLNSGFAVVADVLQWVTLAAEKLGLTWEGMADIAKRTWHEVGLAVTRAMNFVIRSVNSVIDGLNRVASITGRQAIPRFTEMAELTWEQAKASEAAAMMGAKQLAITQAQVKATHDLARSLKDTLGSGMKSALSGAIKGFLEGTAPMTSGLKEGIKTAILSGIAEAAAQQAVFKGVFGKQMENLGVLMADGRWDAARGIIEDIASQVPRVADNLESMLAPLQGALQGFATKSTFAGNIMAAKGPDLSGYGKWAEGMRKSGIDSSMWTEDAYKKFMGIPAMANGALATGPTLGLIGEGKWPEVVAPLSPQVFSQLAAGIVGQMPQMAFAGGGGETYVEINVNAAGDRDWEEKVGERLIRVLARKGIRAR